MRYRCIVKCQRLFLYGVPFVGLITAFTFAMTVEVYCRRGFICETTGPRKGFSVWFGHFETSHWYQESPLETFIRERHPADLRHRWVHHHSTYKNSLGMAIGHGCSFPPIRRLDQFTMRICLPKMSDAEKKRLYDDLVTGGDRDTLERKLKELVETHWLADDDP